MVKRLFYYAFFVLGFFLLVYLAIWQYDRRIYKNNFIATMQKDLQNNPSDVLNLDNIQELPTHFVKINATILPNNLIYFWKNHVFFGPGYEVFGVLDFGKASQMFVSLGFVKEDEDLSKVRYKMPVCPCYGVLREFDSKKDDELKKDTRIIYRLTLPNLLAVSGLNPTNIYASYYLMMLDNPNNFFQNTFLRVKGEDFINIIPNNHLQYFLIWMFLSIIWLFGGIFLFFYSNKQKTIDSLV